MKVVKICVERKGTYLMITNKQKVESRSDYQRILCGSLTLNTLNVVKTSASRQKNWAKIFPGVHSPMPCDISSF